MRHDLLDDWSTWLRAEGKSPHTIRVRVGAVRSACTHAETSDPGALTTIQLLRWLGDLRADWTRCTYYVSARAWHGWLVEEGLRDDDPTQRIKRPRMPRGRPRPVPAQVVERLLDTAPRKAYCYIVLALYAGLRVHEVAKIRGEDVDRERNLLFVRGKGGVDAVLPMHPLVARLAHGQVKSGYWFPGSHEGHVAAGTVSQSISRALRAVGSDATAHGLRHSFGTNVLRACRDLRITQELMRHSSPASTAMYTEVTDVDKHAAIRSLRWPA